MLKFLRLYYNYFLVKWKIRKVLPAYFINRIETADCSEELVPYQGVFVRKRVSAMLEDARRSLPPHFDLKVLSGFRNDAEQDALRKKFGNTQQVAIESGHATGGAVDVILLHCGKEADCGGRYLTFTSATPTWRSLSFLRLSVRTSRLEERKSLQNSIFLKYLLLDHYA